MTAQRARELMEAARYDLDSSWSTSTDTWTENNPHLFLLSAIAESILALTEAVLDADPKDQERLMEKLRKVGRL